MIFRGGWLVWGGVGSPSPASALFVTSSETISPLTDNEPLFIPLFTNHIKNNRILALDQSASCQKMAMGVIMARMYTTFAYFNISQNNN